MPPPHLYTSIMQASSSPRRPTYPTACPGKSHGVPCMHKRYTLIYISSLRGGLDELGGDTVCLSVSLVSVPTEKLTKEKSMSIASRYLAQLLHRSPIAGARAQKTILLARHRFLSSSAPPGNGLTAKVAPAVTITATEAGGGKADQPGVKLDLCGEIEGAASLVVDPNKLTNERPSFDVQQQRRDNTSGETNCAGGTGGTHTEYLRANRANIANTGRLAHETQRYYKLVMLQARDDTVACGLRPCLLEVHVP